MALLRPGQPAGDQEARQPGAIEQPDLVMGAGRAKFNHPGGEGGPIEPQRPGELDEAGPPIDAVMLHLEVLRFGRLAWMRATSALRHRSAA